MHSIEMIHFRGNNNRCPRSATDLTYEKLSLLIHLGTQSSPIWVSDPLSRDQVIFMPLNIPFRARSRGIYVLAIKQSCTINLMTYSSTLGVEFEIDGGLLHATNSLNSPLNKFHYGMTFTG